MSEWKTCPICNAHMREEKTEKELKPTHYFCSNCTYGERMIRNGY